MSANNVFSAGEAGISEKAQAAAAQKIPPGDSEGNKAHTTAQHSPSRSKSYSRSRSRSYSRSRSRSSLCSRSDSDGPRKKRSHKKKKMDKEWKEYYRSLKRVKHIEKYLSPSSNQDAHSEGDNRPSEPSPDIGVSLKSSSLEKLKEKDVSQDLEIKHYGLIAVEGFNNRSEWDSDSDKVSQSNSAVMKKQKAAVDSTERHDKRFAGVTEWTSESDAENAAAKTQAISEKEEGEASSESEGENVRRISQTTAVVVAPAPSARKPEKEPEKHKSKKKAKRKHKHKSRGENKSSSHHSKDKSKRSKKKHQKLKEMFHWQPPLEFGEEEEEDESKRENHGAGGAAGERQSADLDRGKDPNVAHANREGRGQQRARDSTSKNPKQSERPDASSCSDAHPAGIKEQESLEDMDLCTPEHEAQTIVEPLLANKSFNHAPELTLRTTSQVSDKASKDLAQLCGKEEPRVADAAAAGGPKEEAGRPAGAAINFKWKPLKGTLQNAPPVVAKKDAQLQQGPPPKARGLKMEIKSKSRVRPGSLFDEVRKTVRLNRRPRNQESSSEESSASAGKSRGSKSRSPKKATRTSRSVSSPRSRTRGWSHSYSRSRSRSPTSSSSSRSRSRSRRRRGRGRSRSSTYRSYRSHSRTYSRSHSRSRSYDRHRRSRSDSSDSYSSRSRSASRRRGRGRSDSYRSSDRRSRSYRSSSRSSSRGRSHSRSSRYS